MMRLELTPWLSDLLNHLWQSTLLAAFVWLLAHTLLRNNRPHTRHVLWLAASVKFLIPFWSLVTLGSRLGLMQLAPRATQSRFYFAMDEMNRKAAPAILTSALAPAMPAPRIHFPQVVVALWACGTLFVAARWFMAWLRVRSAMRSGRLICSHEGIPVLASGSLRERGVEPGVFGLFRPAVLVPEGIEERLSGEQFDAVLAHECCHARRRDNLAAAIHMLVEALFWFYPVVWWIGKRLVAERERACDQDVARVIEPEVYAEGILNVCKFYVESPLACMSGITGADLKHRIADIMTRRSGRELDWTRKSLLGLLAFLIVPLPLVVGVLETPAVHAQTTLSSFDGRIQTSTNKQFEVATFKENMSDSPSYHLGPPAHGSVSIENIDLRRIVYSAFRTSRQMIIGPAWLDSTRYDMLCKGSDPAGTNEDVWEMMRSLLIDQFKLKYHLEKRTVPVYVLSVAKGGPKLTNPRDGQCAAEIRENKPCGGFRGSPVEVGIVNAPIGALAAILGRLLADRPVIDQTGIKGLWDGSVRWMPDNVKPEDLANIPESERPDDISLFTAIQQQLGLKLEARREPVDAVVIDNIEKPSGTSSAASPQ